jgi:hypothetical protein
MKINNVTVPALIGASLTLSGCSGTNAGAPQTTVSTSSGGSSADGYACPSAMTSSGPLDCATLPLGDRKFSTSSPAVGTVYSCVQLSGKPVVQSAPWINSQNGTWSLPAKLAVRGSVKWPGSISVSVSGTTRTITANALPIAPYRSGIFPISPSDPAYQYDQNPNSIVAQSLSLGLPASPVVASSPSCLSPGLIGITVSGVAIYDAFDGAGYDGAARELQDDCLGHPDPSSTYHIHGSIALCTGDTGSATKNSPLLGYALDGFGVYGPWYAGKVLTTKDLDQCHGTTSVVEWNGKKVAIYHYVATYDFPYSLSCYTGTPIHTGPPPS